MFSLFLMGICILLALSLAWQRITVIRSRRALSAQIKDNERERKATAEIITISRDIISGGLKDDEFLEKFLEYAVRSLGGAGGAVLKSDGEGHFRGCSVAGAMPALLEVSPHILDQIQAHPKKHADFLRGEIFDITNANLEDICGDGGFAFYDHSRPFWIAESFLRTSPKFIVSTISVRKQIEACVIVSSSNDYESHILTPADGRYLRRLTEIAALGLEGLRIFRERGEYEKQLRNAREEGMVQVSTGIIHNIGNAVTVAKLALAEMTSRFPTRPEDRTDCFIQKELLPQMKAKYPGEEFITMLEQLVGLAVSNTDANMKTLQSLNSKMEHISEIIDLQQRFVGELGTENMTRINNVVESSVKIFEESFSKRGVKIETLLSPSIPEILIDPSMMTQVFINIVKNSIEAMESAGTRDKKLTITSSVTPENMVCVSIRDNGPGMTEDIRGKIFQFGFSTKRKRAGGYGLHTCLATVKKYNGTIEVESAPEEGTEFRVMLPLKSPDGKAV